MEHPNNEEKASPIKLKINLRTMEVTNITAWSGSSETSTLLTPKKVTRSLSALRSMPPIRESVTTNDTLDMSVGRIDDEGRYMVETIKNHRILEKSGELQYLIKWLGWENCHNTWERAQNLDGCPKLLEAYHKKLDKRDEWKPRPSKIKKYSKQHASPGSLNDSGVGLDGEDDLRSGPSEQNTLGSNASDSPRRLNDSNMGINELLDVSNEEDRNTSVEYERTEDTLSISFDCIRTDVPKGKKPLRLIHVTIVDDKIVYVVEQRNKNAKAENNNDNREPNILETKNIEVYYGDFFKLKYPAMVIDFYQSRIEPITREDENKAEDWVMNPVLEGQDNSIPDISEELPDLNFWEEGVVHQCLGIQQQPQISGPTGATGYNHQQEQQLQQSGVGGSGSGLGHQQLPMNNDGGPTANFANSHHPPQNFAFDLFEYLSTDNESGEMASFIDDFFTKFDSNSDNLNSNSNNLDSV